MKTYNLEAREGREYDTNTGWIMSDYPENESKDFDTKEKAIKFKAEFISSLKLDIAEILLKTVTQNEDEEDPEIELETIDLIDKSESLKNYVYQINRDFGQYMIPKDKYTVDYVSRTCSTVNELLKVIEYHSFRFHPVAVFKTEEEVREYCENCYVTDSVVPFCGRNNQEETEEGEA